MRRAAVILLGLLLVGLTGPTGRAASSSTAQAVFDEEIECLEPTPRRVAPVPRELDGRRAVIDVLVLLDGVTDAQGHTAARQAKNTFAAGGLHLRASFARVRVPADGVSRETGKRLFTASTSRATAVAKAAVGGKAPAGVEVVYLLTNKDLYLGDDARRGRSYGVAGLADCIGGIAYRHRAFAVGEHLSFGDAAIGPLRYAKALPAKILAHEIGHLLGAHHHYANCGESVPRAVAERTTDACTLMINDVGLASLRFSTLNRSVVRGHGLAYAR